MFIRNCPTCNKILEYSNKYNLKDAINKNKSCVQYAQKSRDRSGKNNPFYGKTHSIKTIEQVKNTKIKNN